MTGFGSREFHFAFSDLNPDQISLVGTPVAIMATAVAKVASEFWTVRNCFSIAYLPLLKFLV